MKDVELGPRDAICRAGLGETIDRVPRPQQGFRRYVVLGPNPTITPGVSAGSVNTKPRGGDSERCPDARKVQLEVIARLDPDEIEFARLDAMAAEPLRIVNQSRLAGGDDDGTVGHAQSSCQTKLNQRSLLVGSAHDVAARAQGDDLDQGFQ